MLKCPIGATKKGFPLYVDNTARLAWPPSQVQLFSLRVPPQFFSHCQAGEWSHTQRKKSWGVEPGKEPRMREGKVSGKSPLIDVMWECVEHALLATSGLGVNVFLVNTTRQVVACLHCTLCIVNSTACHDIVPTCGFLCCPCQQLKIGDVKLTSLQSAAYPL